MMELPADHNEFDMSQLNGFYRHYLSLFEPTTDAPVEFILTALLAGLGAAISLNRWIEWGTKRIYPNIWAILVAPSTHQRKSTALDVGLYFNRRLEEEISGRQLILPNDGSFAALLPLLQEEKHGVIRHSEFASLLENMGKGFNNNMKSLMTDFFDVPRVHNIRLVSDGDIRLERPIFSLAAATTLNWFRQKTTINDLESGFLARFLYCYRENKDRSIPVPNPPDIAECEKFLAAFRKILGFRPSGITYDEGFRRVFCQAYDSIDRLYRDVLVDDGTKALIGRLQTDYFLKLSIIECVLSKTIVATEEIAVRANYLIGYYLAQARRVMGAILKTKRSEHEEKVLHFLAGKGDATMTDLHELFSRNLHAHNIKAILKSLIDANLIAKRKNGRTETYSLFGQIRPEDE